MYFSSFLSVRDLRRLGELQTELAGAADFCATYLRCQLLLMKVRVCVCVCDFVYYALTNILCGELFVISCSLCLKGQFPLNIKTCSYLWCY